MLALVTAARDADMNRVLGLGLFVPADGTRLELRNAERLGFARAFELRSFVYARGFRQVFDSLSGRMR